MARTYFELEDDVDIKGRWYLNGLRDNKDRELDPRDFRYGIPVELGPPLRATLSDEDLLIEAEPPLKMRLRRKGKPLDFTYADFDMPVATAKVANLIAEIAGSDIQRIPVEVGSRKAKYEIINVISRLNCIDPNRSEIDEWWTEEDERPDKIGKPRMIAKLVIDPGRVGNSHFFRPEGWEVVAIVSDVLKDALEKAGVSGVKFSEV